MTNHEAVLESTQRQSVRGAVDTTEDDTALAPKALCVNDAGPPLSCDRVKPEDARKEKSNLFIKCFKGQKTICEICKINIKSNMTVHTN